MPPGSGKDSAVLTRTAARQCIAVVYAAGWEAFRQRMRATPGKPLMSSQASAKDPASPPPAAMSAVTSASTGSGRAGTASPARARLCSGTGTRPRSTRPGRSGLTYGPEDWVFMLYGRSALGERWK
jgi:hypothetical protein